MAGFLKFLDTYGISAGSTLLVIGVGVAIASINFTNVPMGRTVQFIIALSPIWLPLILFFTFYSKWLEYVQKKFKLNQQGRVTLEILIPEEIYKSPEAMELMLTQLYQTSTPDNLFQTYLDGKHPPTFGLEIVSTGGRVHFYINTWRKKLKNIIEAQLYAQYPGIEIRELPIDYTAEIAKDDDNWTTFTIHFGLKKPDVYPIKTYVDYGLTDLPKEEEKTDPITTVLDMLASITPDERVWFQLLIRAHREEKFALGSLFKQHDWKDDIDKEIEAIYEKAKARGKSSDDDEGYSSVQLTDGEKFKIKALERSRSKFAFNTKLRAIYAARKGKFASDRMGAIITSTFSFTDANLNALGAKWRTDVDYKWSDPKGKRVKRWKQITLDHYKRRNFDPMSNNDKQFILTVEELATIFHLPGRVELNPNLERIPSTRGEAPPNLPIG